MQCGGKGFQGSACCGPEADCVARSSDFSQCVPKAPGAGAGVAARSEPKRAAVGWFGDPAQDPDDTVCSTEPWTQCDGKGYSGDKCCPKGYTCTYRTDHFSQCTRKH